MRWAAIDFETATRSRTSACAVGIVLVDDGAIVEERGWLIRPPGNRYEPFNIRIHGIKPEQTAAVPAFDGVWPEVDEMLGDRMLIAHNAPFDMGVLRRSGEHTGTTVRDHDFACTVALARRTWPTLGYYNLKAVCAALEVELINHHDAVADARACAQVALHVANVIGPETVESLARPLTPPRAAA
jgi:DNA polymerase-3 subunit epsilon